MRLSLTHLPAWIINLDRSADRWVQCYQSMAPVLKPDKIHRLSGVDGRDFMSHEPDAIDGWNPTELHRLQNEGLVRKTNPLQPVMTALCLSHQRALRAFLESGSSWGLIFEDDARPCQELYRMIASDVLIEPPNDAELLFLHNRVRRRGGIEVPDAPTSQVHWRTVRGGLGFEAYAVSISGAHKMLAVMRPAIWECDLQVIMFLEGNPNSKARGGMERALQQNGKRDLPVIAAYAPQLPLFQSGPGIPSVKLATINEKSKESLPLEPPIYTILNQSTSCGQVGEGSSLGFESGLGDKVVPPAHLEGWRFLSAHADSVVELQLHRPAEIAGFLNATTSWNSVNPVFFLVDENCLGVVYGPLNATTSFRLERGIHRLRIHSRAVNRHSVWALRPCSGSPIPKPRLKIITAAYYPADDAPRILYHLTRSVLRLGMIAHVEGVGMTFENLVDAKIRKLLTVVTNVDEEFILFSDARDSLLLGSESEIIDRFLSFDAPFVISMERNCWPISAAPWRKSFPEVKSGCRWPNSGNWIGTKQGVSAVLEKCLEIVEAVGLGKLEEPWQSLLLPDRNNDQAVMQYCYLKGGMVGDSTNKLFGNFVRASHRLTQNPDYELTTDRRVVCRTTGEHPIAIHFAGGTYSKCRDQWAARLGIS